MIRVITPTPIPPAELARDRTVQVRDALRAIAGLTHDGAIESWCDHPDVSRGDLAALFALLGDQLEADQQHDVRGPGTRRRGGRV